MSIVAVERNRIRNRFPPPLQMQIVELLLEKLKIFRIIFDVY